VLLPHSVAEERPSSFNSKPEAAGEVRGIGSQPVKYIVRANWRLRMHKTDRQEAHPTLDARIGNCAIIRKLPLGYGDCPGLLPVL